MPSCTKGSNITHPDDFHFIDSFGSTEEITRYVPGGYHPVVIGDILCPPLEKSESASRRYRIMHKLGHGTYGTVWLAQRTDASESFVAAKITTADGGRTREAVMLEAASKQSNSRKSPHVASLLDHFTLDGPNGTHFVLVTEVVVPILSDPYQRSPLWRKGAAYGLTEAVAALHTAAIVHGDLHLGNVGVAMAELVDQDPEDVMQALSSYDVTIILPVSAANQTPSLPAYITAPCDIGKYYNRIACSDFPRMKIFDFGAAHEAGTLPLSFQCAREACAPELVFARIVEKNDNPPVEPPADVWALGTAIYEIVAGSSLFDSISISTPLLCRMVVVAGSLPPGWERWYASLSKAPEVSAGGADEWWASKAKPQLRRNCADEADTNALIVLLRKILVLDPSLRLTAAEVLKDPWFLHLANKPKLIVPAERQSIRS